MLQDRSLEGKMPTKQSKNRGEKGKMPIFKEDEQGRYMVLPTKIEVHGEYIEMLAEIFVLYKKTIGFSPKVKDVHRQIFEHGIKDVYTKLKKLQH